MKKLLLATILVISFLFTPAFSETVEDEVIINEFAKMIIKKGRVISSGIHPETARHLILVEYDGRLYFCKAASISSWEKSAFKCERYLEFWTRNF